MTSIQENIGVAVHEDLSQGKVNIHELVEKISALLEDFQLEDGKHSDGVLCYEQQVFSYFGNEQVINRSVSNALFDSSEHSEWLGKSIFDLLEALKRRFQLQSDVSFIVPALNLKFPINMSYTKLITLGQLWALHETLFAPNPFYTKIEVDSTNFEIRLEELLNLSFHMKASNPSMVTDLPHTEDNAEASSSHTVADFDPLSLIESDGEEDDLLDDQISVKTCDSSHTNRSTAWSTMVCLGGETNSTSASFIDEDTEIQDESLVADESNLKLVKKRSSDDMDLCVIEEDEEEHSDSSKKQKSEELAEEE